ncbi:hypothetical protein ACPCIZ_12955 [Streptomyces cellulosae]
MSEIPQEEPAQTQADVRSHGWCSWHKGYSEGVRLVAAIEQASGPGVGLFACEPCREANALIPFADLL